MADEAPIVDALCPSWATGVGYMGVAAAVILSNWGSAVSAVLAPRITTMAGSSSTKKLAVKPHSFRFLGANFSLFHIFSNNPSFFDLLYTIAHSQCHFETSAVSGELGKQE